jgi:hypothetical protein
MGDEKLATLPTAAFQVRQSRALPPIDHIMQMANVLYLGGLSSKSCGRPEAVAARIIAGWELGLAPVQSVNNIMVTNGRATIWGDAAIALVRASGLLDLFEERIDGQGDNRVAMCRIQRRGEQVREARFSVDDAIRANLWAGGNASKNALETPWAKYPQRMLQMKARSWLLRDTFADVLCGLGVTEDNDDWGTSLPPVVEVAVDTPTIVQARQPQLAVAPTPAPTPAPTLIQQIASKLPAWLEAQSMTIDQFRERLHLNTGKRKVSELDHSQMLALLMEIDGGSGGNSGGNPSQAA